jgi:two-component system, OmpR family, sensor histidine kinase MprB
VTFRRRLTLVSAAAVAVAIVAASAIVYFVVRDQLRGQVDDSLRSLAGAATLNVPGGAPIQATGSRGGFTLPVPPPARAAGGGRARLMLPPAPLGGPQGLAQVITASGRVVHSLGDAGALPVSEQARAVAAGSSDAFLQDVDVGGDHLRVLTEPMGRGHAIQVARSLEEVDGTLRTLLLVLGLVSLGGVAAAALLGWAISRTAVAPLAELTETAEHVARTSDLDRRIETSGSRDELARLAASFNAMLAELDRSVTAQRRLVADASHELRTPLTSLRTNIEVLAAENGLAPQDRDRLLGDVTAQLGELGVLVGNLVDLAREEEPDADPGELRLDELVAEAVERAGRNAPGRRFRLAAVPCEVRGVADLLERAVANLLDNAAKWSPPDGDIEVTVRDGEVSVRDHGPGIDPADLPHVFERFYRAPSARGMPGSGLGLAIVSQVAEAHGGSVAAGAAAGGGTVVTLHLPAVRPAALPAITS